jgi:multidrug transporter EmrE-like cation transporter
MSLTNITLMSLSEILGDFGFKNVARAPSVASWAAGLTGYAGIIFFLIKSLRMGNVVYVNGMWDGVSALLSSLFAIFIMGERLNTMGQYLGLFFVIGGLFLIKGGGIPYN